MLVAASLIERADADAVAASAAHSHDAHGGKDRDSAPSTSRSPYGTVRLRPGLRGAMSLADIRAAASAGLFMKKGRAGNLVVLELPRVRRGVVLLIDSTVIRCRGDSPRPNRSRSA
jgi:hypothetical protein